MKKYNKVSDFKVLYTYELLTNKLWDFPYVPIEIIAEELGTSKYQIRKAYKKLEKAGFMEKIEVPTVTADYDNGLYIVEVPILKCRVFTITAKGVKICRELKELGYEEE